MTERSSRFTSDRRGREEASWVGEEDWNAGFPENVDVLDGSLVSRGLGSQVESEIYHFSSFDTDVWTLHGDATHSTSEAYVQLHPNVSDTDGRLAYNDGMIDPDHRWAIDITFSQNNGDTDEISVNWYANDPAVGSRSASEGYVLETDYWKETIRLTYRTASSTITLASAWIGHQTGTIDLRIEWDRGSYTVYYQGSQIFAGEHSSPDHSRSGLFFGSWCGGQASYKRIHQVALEWGW
jgi:hypothetical protein